MIDKKKQGKANKAKGARFELAVRKDLETQDWIVSKFRCNVEVETGKVVVARNTFIPRRGMMLGSGFPDFVCLGCLGKKQSIIFVECKFNGKLTNEEKLKLDVLVKKGFQCYVAQDEEDKIYYRKFVEYKEREKIHRKPHELGL